MIYLPSLSLSSLSLARQLAALSHHSYTIQHTQAKAKLDRWTLRQVILYARAFLRRVAEAAHVDPTELEVSVRNSSKEEEAEEQQLLASVPPPPAADATEAQLLAAIGDFEKDASLTDPKFVDFLSRNSGSIQRRLETAARVGDAVRGAKTPADIQLGEDGMCSSCCCCCS